MASLKEVPVLAVSEGVEVSYLAPAERDRQVARLDEPWIAGESAVDARLERRRAEPADLLPRGLAFDRERTVVWDEDGVQVVAPAPPAADVVAHAQAARVRDGLEGPEELVRIDYVRHGVWLASRYLPMTFDEFGSQDHA